jgi:hypothetical protein
LKACEGLKIATSTVSAIALDLSTADHERDHPDCLLAPHDGVREQVAQPFIPLRVQIRCSIRVTQVVHSGWIRLPTVQQRTEQRSYTHPW